MVEIKNKIVEQIVSRIIFASRWLQVPMYFGIILSLFLLVLHIFQSVIFLFKHIFHTNDEQLIIAILMLCELVLLANLAVIVTISGYQNFIAKISIVHEEGDPIWIKKLGYSDVKMKILSSIVAISSIQLLKLFLMKDSSLEGMILALAAQAVFVVSLLLLSVINLIDKKCNIDQ